MSVIGRVVLLVGSGAAFAAFAGAFAMTASSMGCERAGARAPATPIAITMPGVDAAPPEQEPARWERAGDGGNAWRLGEGAHPTPLVVRGVAQPKNPDDTLWVCEEHLGARRGGPPLELEIEGPKRTLHAFARAVGPIAIVSGQSCVVARAGEWAHVELETEPAMRIEVLDADIDGERRGQTSPYVLVVGDGTLEPSLLPAERAPLAANEAAVRWALTPADCPQGLEGWTCLHAALELSGAETRRIAMPRMLHGQSGCWPNGTGIRCAGASGASDLSLTQAKDGTVEVSEYAVSDGYCPPPEDCGATTHWSTFKVKPTSKLVPDPAGTFPAR